MTPPFLPAVALLLAAALPSPATAQASPPNPAFDRAAWKSDYARLKTALAQGYANLDWQVDRRNFNLAGADRAISAMLDKAESDVEATLIFARLVDAFKDPHLQLSYGPAPAPATLLPRLSDNAPPLLAAELCKASNYGSAKPATRLP